MRYPKNVEIYLNKDEYNYLQDKRHHRYYKMHFLKGKASMLFNYNNKFVLNRIY